MTVNIRNKTVILLAFSLFPHLVVPCRQTMHAAVIQGFRMNLPYRDYV
nr:hypothetical protein Itr_chr02CG17290 [Ipomoea trifida]